MNAIPARLTEGEGLIRAVEEAVEGLGRCRDVLRVYLGIARSRPSSVIIALIAEVCRLLGAEVPRSVAGVLNGLDPYTREEVRRSAERIARSCMET
mgnify:CR=1 FL=1